MPATGVDSVVLNLTSTEASAPSYLTLFPAGGSKPMASTLNTEVGQDVPNLVVAKVGAGGKVSIYNNAGSGHVVADVVGFYDTGPGP